MRQTTKSNKIAELRRSDFHQQLGRKLSAAFVSQQQGIQIGTALKKVEEPVGDFWLQLAETVREAWASDRRWDGPIPHEPSTQIQ